MNDWTDIHKDFSKYYQNLWKNHGFDYQTTKEWAEVLGENFKIEDFSFCIWLKAEKHLTPQETRRQGNIKNLRTEYNKLWSEIHKDFAETFQEEYYGDYEDSEDNHEQKSYQRIWEENGFTYEEAREWIKSELKPKDNEEVQKWKSKGFTPQEVHQWIELGFRSYHDIDKAHSWKEQGFDFQQTREWIQSGWELDDSRHARDWKDQGFAAQESQGWMKAGFDSYDYEEAKKWKECNFIPRQVEGWLKAGLNKKFGAKFAKFLLIEGYNFASFPDNNQLEKLKEAYIHETNDWSAIDPDFGRYQQEWEEAGFDFEQTREWTNVGLKPFNGLEAKRWKKKGFNPEQTKLWFDLGLGNRDFGFVDWLVKEKNCNPEQAEKKDIAELRSLYFSPWNEINEDFSKYNYHERWEECNFTAQETKEWIQIGLLNNEAEFVLYLKQKGYTPATVDKQRLRNQTWLDWKYPLETRKEIKELEITNKALTGSLNLNDFVNLEKLDCYENWLTSLDISSCEKLVELDCCMNQLVTLSLPKQGKKLIKLKVGEQATYSYGYSNQLTDLSIFSHLENLEEFDLSYIPFLAGNLEPLKYLTKLKSLDVSKTKLDSGLEYLPDSLEYFDCSAKLAEIWDSSFSFQESNDVGDRLQRYKTELIKWKKLDFTIEQAVEWIRAGLKLDDADYARWLRDIKQADTQWVLNHETENQELKERYRELGLCSECQQPYAREKWCKFCNLDGKEVDTFVQEHQLKKTGLEWIPYNKFTNIEYLAAGGFGKIYKARWNGKNVVLKSLDNFQNLTTDFLQEVACNKLVDNSDSIVSCHGISQDPETKNYTMVMQYIEGGDLRKHLKNNFKEIDFYRKLEKLISIIVGLNQIHEKGLVHRDFHSGNILNETNDCYITDLGLCRPASEINKEGKVYGVLPYVAPEVLVEKKYSQASDVYSFGIIAYELLTNSYPYPKLNEIDLTLKICDGLRPNIKELKTPQLLKDLIERCWDADPAKRPTANELEETLSSWLNEMLRKKNTEFYQQYKEIKIAGGFNQTLSDNDLIYQTYPQAVYHSKLLDTRSLPWPQNSKEINEQFWGTTDLDLQISTENLGQFNLQEENQQTEQQAQILQINPHLPDQQNQ